MLSIEINTAAFRFLLFLV